MIKKIVIVLSVILLFTSCENYSYPKLADEIKYKISSSIEPGEIYECKTDIDSIKYCSYENTEYGFMIVFYDYNKYKLYQIERVFTITSHDKVKINRMIVFIDGVEYQI